MKTNKYMEYNYQFLKILEYKLRVDSKDCTLTPKEQASIRKELKLVQDALKTK